MTNEERYFRWVYRLLVELSKEELRLTEVPLPWSKLDSGRRAILIDVARERAGIDQETFLEGARQFLD